MKRMKLANFEDFSDECEHASIPDWRCEIKNMDECLVGKCTRCKIVTLQEYIDRGGKTSDYPDLFSHGYDTVEVVE